MKNHVFYLVSLSLLISTFTPVLPLTIPSPFKAKNGAINDFDQKAAMQALGASIQQFAFIAHNLITVTTKNKSDNSSISKTYQKVVDTVEKTYGSMVVDMRAQVFSPDLAIQKKAIATFGNYVLSLCNEFGVRNKYFMKLPVTLDSTLPLEAQIALINQAVTLLENLFIKIKPLPPIYTRVANIFLYNFVSTKMIPKLISFGVGPVAAALLASYNAARFTRDLKEHKHKNPFLNYVKVPHNEKVTWVNEPNFIQQTVFGSKPTKETVTPCRGNDSYHNICNGDKHIDRVQLLCKEFNIPRSELSEFMKQNVPSWLDKDENYSTEDLLRRTFFSYDRDNTVQQLSNQFNIDQQELEKFAREYTDIQWAYGCNGNSDGCYHKRGFASAPKAIGSTLWATRPLVLLPVFYFIGKWMEEAQLPEYEFRIRLKEKIAQEKKVLAEMKRMKVNYEKSIGFAQIKGQKDLIEREMKMIADYLKNPLRYKNSASGTRSILLYGPPGTGKTLLARAIAKESGAPFLEVTADDILHNDAKEKILATIRLAEDVASKRPEKSAIIYIDEIDAVTGNRQDGALDPQRSKALSNLLTIFDGIEKRNPYVHIVIIITTNHYKNLDPALLRPGRIDRKILIAPPNAEGRQEFFEELLPVEHKHLMSWLVPETEGYSGAQIVNIVDTAQMIASYGGRVKPSEQDYRASLQNCKAEYDKIQTVTKE